MENLLLNLSFSLLFVFFCRKLNSADYAKLCVSVKNTLRITSFSLIVSLVLFIVSAEAAETATATASAGKGCNVDGLFSDLICKGAMIFNGMRDIIYVVAGFGIIGVSVGGFFGNLNWKWLGAIVIGLMVIGLTGSIISYIGADKNTAAAIGNTLK